MDKGVVCALRVLRGGDQGRGQAFDVLLSEQKGPPLPASCWDFSEGPRGCTRLGT